MKRLTLPIIITALSTWTAGPAHAEKPIADGKWRGTASASLALTSGNSSTQAFLLNADVARLTAQDKISLSGYINEARSKADGKTSQTANKLGAAGRYDYNLSPQVFGFGALGLDRDGIIDLSLRTLVSTGVGYHLINTSTETFDVYGGVSFVDARYSSDQIIGDKTGRHFDTTGLVLGEASTHKFNENVSALQRLEYYPGLTGFKSQLIKFNASLNVAMTTTMALTVGVIDTYNSKVGAGMKKNDVSLFTGVSVKFGG